MKFFDEFTYWIFLAVALTLFVTGFKGLFPIATAKLPLPDGFREALKAN